VAEGVLSSSTFPFCRLGRSTISIGFTAESAITLVILLR